MKARTDCIVCGARGREITRNNLPMLLCDSCGLFWLAYFDLAENHYEDMDFLTEKTGKTDARYANALGRIEAFRKYANLDNLCDIGCGEGIFLKALSDLGYKNSIGLEPGMKAQDFAVRNKLAIQEGRAEDVDESFFSANGIHTVSLFHVIEHLKDPAGVMEKIFGSIKKGDKLILETPDADSYVLRKTGYRHELIYPEHLYYFDKRNLHMLLEKTGFTVIASGNRDFNEKNMSIKESLARLGFINMAGTKETAPGHSDDSIDIPASADGIFRRIVRRVLSEAVIMLGRGNYQWVIAEK